ncbi:39S ribosomal protein L12, mitochondrial [Polistes fuscatus]|uniref:39S ribosomal protein L12, mitochondrial n=1 Tax=Polistes fuscatus TaxID=30207 RepID=UPI001CA91F3C|nr:39S ribosomal protein L12, mitochondrial [Polistes fuscatus]
MILSLRMIARNSIYQFRQFHKCVVVCQSDAAPIASTRPTENLTIPVPEGMDKPVSAKLDQIAKDIISLNLIEVMELSNLLKKRLNLPDAPVMPVGGFAPAPKQEEEEAPKAVKTSFTVKLLKFDEKQKVPLIKEIKNLLPNTNLVQAKKFIESIPVVVMADISKEEADKLKETISKVGGEVEIT